MSNVFWFCALSGSGFFLFQILFGFLGSLDEEGGSFESGKFRWMSRQAVTGFLMMFGWMGLACEQELGLPLGWTFLLAAFVGFFSMGVTAFIFHGAGRLQSPGTVFHIDQAIGQEAIVYHRIPKQGKGTVSLSIEGIAREIDAVSLNGQEIGSFLKVTIGKKIDETTVEVYLQGDL